MTRNTQGLETVRLNKWIVEVVVDDDDDLAIYVSRPGGRVCQTDSDIASGDNTWAERFVFVPLGVTR